MPIWYNPKLKLNFSRNSFEKGLKMLRDIFESFGLPMTMEKFENINGVQTHILEVVPNPFPIIWAAATSHQLLKSHKNSNMNIIVNRDKRAFLLFAMKFWVDPHTSYICTTWNRRDNVSLYTMSITRSFLVHNIYIADVFLDMLQFGSHTNYSLQNSMICLMLCDSKKYTTLSTTIAIIGDLESKEAIDTIILLGKVVCTKKQQWVNFRVYLMCEILWREHVHTREVKG